MATIIKLLPDFDIGEIIYFKLGGEEPMKAVVSYGDKFFLTRSGGFIGENSQELFKVVKVSLNENLHTSWNFLETPAGACQSPA